MAAELTRATGREIGYLPITAAQYADAAVAAGVPAEEIEPLSDLFARVLDGHNAHLTDGVRTGAGPPAPRLRRLRARHRGHRRLVARGRRRAPMTGSQARQLTVAAALGGGLSAGVYLAFSTVVMPGLRKLPR